MRVAGPPGIECSTLFHEKHETTPFTYAYIHVSFLTFFFVLLRLCAGIHIGRSGREVGQKIGKPHVQRVVVFVSTALGIAVQSCMARVSASSLLPNMKEGRRILL